MNQGKIIMLQGASSAGKSTVARALQASLEEYWWVFEADDISRMQGINVYEPAQNEKRHPSWDSDVRLQRWLDGYWQCIATIARTGSNVIAVGGWLQDEWLFQLSKAVEDLDAYCVGVHCPLEECERREVKRGDRGIGYARSQFEVVLVHAPHDADVDTHSQSTKHCVEAIENMLKTSQEDSFFQRIRNSEPYAGWINEQMSLS